MQGIIPFCSAGIQQVTPWKRRRNGSKIAKHFFYDVTNGIGWVFRFAATLEASIYKELEKVKDEGPQQHNCRQGVGCMVIYVGEIPILDPLVEGSVLDVPSRADSF